MPSRFSQRWTVVTSRLRCAAISFHESRRSSGIAALHQQCGLSSRVRYGGHHCSAAALAAKDGIRRQLAERRQSLVLPFDRLPAGASIVSVRLDMPGRHRKGDLHAPKTDIRRSARRRNRSRDAAMPDPVHAARDRDRPSPPPRHFSGLINDYTPSAAVVGGGPYEMRGKWSLDLDERRGTATSRRS